MGFFKKLFGQSESSNPKSKLGSDSGKNAITLLFRNLPRFKVQGPIFLNQNAPLPLDFTVITDGRESMANLTIGKHRLLLVGFSAALPNEVQQNTIHLSNWPEEAKQEMYGHEAHLICYYESGSDDPIEQLLLLYKLAAAFVVQGLLGVADETAMTANPAGVIEKLFVPIHLEPLRQDKSLPYVAWCGLLKLIKPDGQVWWVSRGHERFGMPDLAHLAPMGQGERIMDLFETLLNYMYYFQARIEAGHTAELGASQLAFDEPDEYADYIATATNPALVVTINS
jgi:hypothetical protein